MNKNRVYKIIGISAILIIFACLATLRLNSVSTEKGELFDEYLLVGENFNLRVTAYYEKGFFLPTPGAFYTYQYQIGTGEDWYEITTFRHDDQIVIPRNQLCSVNSNIAYFYIGWIYGITTDGGKTWAIWDAEKDLDGWQPANYSLIEDIQLSGDGKGIMYLNPIRFSSEKLLTEDFGRTWCPKDESGIGE